MAAAILFDVSVLPLEHRPDTDPTDVGDDQLQQQFAAQVAKVRTVC